MTATPDEELRERLRAFVEVADSATTEEHVYELTINDLVKLVRSELSRAGGERADERDEEVAALRLALDSQVIRLAGERDAERAQAAVITEERNQLRRQLSETKSAGGERTQAGPGAPVTEEESDREFSEEYKQWREDGDDCGFGVPLEEAEHLAEVVVGLRRETASLRAENERLRSQLSAVEADHRELSDQSIVNAQRLGSVCDNWHNWAVEIVGKEAARKMSGQGMRGEILRRLETAAADLSTLRAALAKAEEELAELREFEKAVREADAEVFLAETSGKLRVAVEDLDKKRGAR